MSTKTYVVMGLGQIGGTFAQALLRAGHPVHPIVRGQDPAAVLEGIAEVERVVVAVGEADLGDAIASVPARFRDRLLLLQNELLPPAWERHGAIDPTVAVVWFEQKKDKARKVILPTPLAGPGADEMVRALEGLGIAAERVDGDRLVLELVAKNLYILTANIAGLQVGGTVGALLEAHGELTSAIARDVLRLEAAKLGRAVDEEAAMARFAEAIAGDPEHGAMGRSAPSRLERALQDGARLGVDLPQLREIAASSR